MPIIQLKDCSVEGDLAQSVLDYNQQLGEIETSLLKDLGNVNIDLSGLDAINQSLDLLGAAAPNPVPYGDIADQIGTPQVGSAQEDDESRLEGLGIIMVRGIAYLAGTDGNISAFRKLYFALGADNARFLSVLQGTDTLAVVQTYLKVQVLPSTQPTWTIQQVRTLFGNPAIEKVYSGGDGKLYCIIPQFLALNQGRDQVVRQYQIDDAQVLTQVFWLRVVAPDIANIQRLQNMGVEGDFLSSAITGLRLATNRPETLANAQSAADQTAMLTIQQADLLTKRFTQLSAADKEISAVPIRQGSKKALSQRFQVQQVVRFEPTLVQVPEDFQVFLSRNTPADISYLLSTRQSVTSIRFGATRDEIAEALLKVSNIPAGSSTLSNLAIQKQAIQLDTPINLENQSLCQTKCSVDQFAPTPLPYGQLTQGSSCLKASLVRGQPAPPPAIPATGYASYDSPATILGLRLNYTLTLTTGTLFDELDKMIAGLTGILKLILSVIALILRTIKATIDRVMAQLQATLQVYIQQIQAFMSRFASIAGTVGLDSSILKCIFDYNINLTLPFLDDLAANLAALVRKITNEIAKVAQFIAKFVTDMLCYPLNFLNEFLGKVDDALPAFCRTQKIALPSDIEALLLQIKNTFQVQQDLGFSFNRDLVRLNAGVSTSPLKLNRFQKSLVCESQANAQLFTAIKIAMGLSNPLGAAANVVKAVRF